MLVSKSSGLIPRSFYPKSRKFPIEDLPQLPLCGGDYEEYAKCLSVLTDIIEGSYDPDLGRVAPVAHFPQTFMERAATTSTLLLGVAHAVSLKLWLLR